MFKVNSLSGVITMFPVQRSGRYSFFNLFSLVHPCWDYAMPMNCWLSMTVSLCAQSRLIPDFMDSPVSLIFLSTGPAKTILVRYP